MDATTRDGMQRAIEAVIVERQRQEAKWGEQNHPMVPADIVREAHAHGAAPEFFACHILGIDDAHEDIRAKMEPCETIEDARRRIASMYAGDNVSAEDIEACAQGYLAGWKDGGR